MDFSKVTEIKNHDEYLEAQILCDAWWDKPETPAFQHLLDLVVTYEEKHEDLIREIYGDDSPFSWDDTFEFEDNFPFS